MGITGWCGDSCSECSKSCSLDERIPCSPDCENLTKDGNILIRKCLEDGCPEVKYIFDMTEASDEDIIRRYGEKALYPYI